MLRNYLRITLRNVVRQPGYSFINIAGLATGMAAFVLIMMFIQHERSINAHHEHADRLYRVDLEALVAEQSVNTANSPAVMAGAFLDAFPELEQATRFEDFSSNLLITVGNRSFFEPNFFLADSSVFSMFTFPLVSGDPGTALNRPNTVVLSESTARKYFGTREAVGRTIRWEDRLDLEVTAVMADVPDNVHFRPEILASFLSSSQWDSPIWLNNSYVTYLLLREGADPDILAAKFRDLQRSTVGPQIEQFMGTDFDQALASGLRYDWTLTRLSDAYLHSDAEDQLGTTGDVRYLYILGVIAAFVLLIACINFMNLSTARATGRAREVGVRKVMGSDRSQLVRQFLAESTVIAFISMGVAFLLVLAVLPYFETLAGAALHIAPWLVGALVATALLTGLVAGLYPAFVLSSFRPAVVLKGSFARSRQGMGLRSALVVFQFSITVFLLVGTTVVYKQLRFIQNQDLGFDQEQLVVIPLDSPASRQGFPTFRTTLLGHSGVAGAASGGMLPGPERIHNTTGFRAEGHRDDQIFLAGLGEISADYVETLDLSIVAGRDFSESFPSDSTAFLITEAMAAQLGWTPESAVGKQIFKLEDVGERPGTVIGVVGDAHYTSVHQSVKSLVFGNLNTGRFYAIVRLGPQNVAETLAYIERVWSTYEPAFPFTYFFMDEDYARFYERERRLGTLYTYFTVLAILIACLGLFGLASFVTTQRTREIGVRKALGATAGSIVYLLTREFARPIVGACVIAFPLAWFAMSRWLQDFAYATEIGWGVFVLAGLSALLVAGGTIAGQSVRAALSDPVSALRYE